LNKKLTIHFFVQSVHTQGTYFRYHNFAIGLHNAGHTVRVFGATYLKNEKSEIQVRDGIEYHITACYFPLQALFGQWGHPLAALKRIFKKYPACDVSHVFQPHLSALLPWRLHRRKAKLNVYDWDDLWTDGLMKKGTSFLGRWSYNQIKSIERIAPKLAQLTTVCSRFLEEKSITNGAVKTSIIYNGFWPAPLNTREESRRKMQFEEGVLYIGFMGRTVDEIKWCFALLESAIASFPTVRMALCGMPAEVLSDIAEPLRSRIDYKGIMPPIETRDFANAIDMGLLPLEDNLFNQSRFPIKFAEYLAVGTPVSCTNVGECANIAKEYPFVKISGTAVSDWVESTKQMLQQIIDNQLIPVDKQKIEEKLSWVNITKGLEEEYLQALS